MEGVFKAILFLIFYFNLMYFMDMPHRGEPHQGDVAYGILGTLQIMFMYYFYYYSLGIRFFERLKSRGAEVLFGISFLPALCFILNHFSFLLKYDDTQSSILLNAKKMFLLFLVISFFAEVKNRSSRRKTVEHVNSKPFLKKKSRPDKGTA